MSILKTINKRIRRDGVAADVNAVLSANVGRGSSSTHVSSHQRIVQRGGETRVEEHRHVEEGRSDD